MTTQHWNFSKIQRTFQRKVFTFLKALVYKLFNRAVIFCSWNTCVIGQYRSNLVNDNDCCNGNQFACRAFDSPISQHLPPVTCFVFYNKIYVILSLTYMLVRVFRQTVLLQSTWSNQSIVLYKKSLQRTSHLPISGDSVSHLSQFWLIRTTIYRMLRGRFLDANWIT